MARYRSYRDPSLVHERDIPLSEAAELETHPAVIAAINAVATDARPPRAIWKAPTGAEAAVGFFGHRAQPSHGTVTG
jgi:hypothetical protein